MEKPDIRKLRIIGSWPGLAQYLLDDETKMVWKWSQCNGALVNCGPEAKFRAIFKDMYRGKLFA